MLNSTHWSKGRDSASENLYARLSHQSKTKTQGAEPNIQEDVVCSRCGLPTDLCVCETIAQEEARISVTVERRKWGRLTTVVEGFDKTIDLGDLATKLKGKLACGGAAKHGHIELQGDHRGVISDVLAKLGFPEEMVQIDWTFKGGRRR